MTLHRATCRSRGTGSPEGLSFVARATLRQAINDQLRAGFFHSMLSFLGENFEYFVQCNLSFSIQSLYVSLHAKRIQFKMIDPVIDPQNNPKIDQIDPKINQNNQMIDQINPKINQNNPKIDQSNPFFLSCGSLLYCDDRSWIDPLQLFTFFANSRLQ